MGCSTEACCRLIPTYSQDNHGAQPAGLLTIQRLSLMPGQIQHICGQGEAFG